MKKQSLVYMHGLLVQIRNELRDCGDVPADAYGEYDERNVSPMSVHRRKGAHGEAIGLLGEGILRTIAHQRDENELEKRERPLPSRVDGWELPDQ
ncbi:UPF0058 family protein [Natronococcus wangiae]|uniref:UPF0058 family protein n=1 Tax=Natronococcus wangiae TaxID=3068275 RepID=UPI00273D812F|nr:UPF0058 family protein [Natronococcus sp. AD5]